MQEALDELGVARAIASGELSSPQRYENLWLFAIRITGLGASFRKSLDEYVWREPAVYQNEDFLARCNGLPVVWEHPDEKPMLDSKEFSNRIVGTVFVPYFKDDEVWGVAKIYDDAAAQLMLEGKLSTSPGVVFREATSTNEKVELESGKHLLIEGKPALLDHIAICELGVWDKGGPPAGVDCKGAEMADDNTAAVADNTRADSEQGTKLDTILSEVKAFAGRMDAYEARARKDAEEKEEKERKDAEEEKKKEAFDKAKKDAQMRLDAAKKDRFAPRKDKESDEEYCDRFDADEDAVADSLEQAGAAKADARRDARAARRDAERKDRKDQSTEGDAKEREELRKEKERMDAGKKDAKKDESEEEELKKERESREDAARKDAQISELRAQLDELRAWKTEATREESAEEQNAKASAQARADSVAAMFGDRAPAPMPGETSLAYRRRMAQRFQKHSPTYKDSAVGAYDAAALASAEDRIYADAVNTARTTPAAAPGVLIPVVTREAGRDITRFHGDIGSWMQHFMTGAQVGKINRPRNAF